MNTGRLAPPGKTRACPHCKATILESSSVCPGCHHHLRFDPAGRERSKATPLSVEGTIRHPATGSPWEYSVVLAVRNSRGEEITRQVVGVGALQPLEERTFALSVEVFAASEAREPAGAPAPAASAGASTRAAAGPAAGAGAGAAAAGAAAARPARPVVRPGTQLPPDPRPPAPPRSEPRVLPAATVPGRPDPRAATSAPPRPSAAGLPGRDPRAPAPALAGRDPRVPAKEPLPPKAK